MGCAGYVPPCPTKQHLLRLCPTFFRGYTLWVNKKSARLSLRLSEETRKRLLARAAALDRSANWLAGRYIEKGLAREKNPDRPKDLR